MSRRMILGAAAAAAALALYSNSHAAIPVIQEDFQDDVGGSWKDNTGNTPVNVGLPGQWVPSGHVPNLNPLNNNQDNDWSPLVQNEVGAAGPVPTGEYFASLNRTGNQTGTPGVFDMDGIIRFTLANGTARPAVTGEKIVGSFDYRAQEGNFGFGFTDNIAALQAYQATMPQWESGSSPLMMPTAYSDTESGPSGTVQWGFSSNVTGQIAFNGGFNGLFTHAVVDIAENGGQGDGFVDQGNITPKTDANSTANRPIGPSEAGSTRQTIRFEYTLGNSNYDLLQVDQDGPDGPKGFVDILQAPDHTPTPGGPMPVGKVMNTIEGMFITGADKQLTEVWYDNIQVSIVVPTVGAAWGVNNDGNWSVGSNWTGGIAPNGIDNVATFGSVITAAHTVTVDAPQTVGTITFDSVNSYTIAGSSALTLDVSSGQAAIDVLAGNHTISAPLTLNKDTTITTAASTGVDLSGALTATGKTITKAGAGTVQFANVRAAGLSVTGGTARISAKGTANSAAGTSVVASLAISAGANLDLANNAAVIDYTGAVGTLVDDVRLHLASGRLMSSSADATKGLGYADNAALGLASFAGQTVDADSVLIKYTWFGDTNLDGQVDVIDLGNLATAWQTNSVWAGGDSNYDGFVDVIDLGLLATNWQAGVGSPLGPGSLPEALAAYGLPSVSVPEPASFGLLGMGCAAMAMRRRRPAHPEEC